MSAKFLLLLLILFFGAAAHSTHIVIRWWCFLSVFLRCFKNVIVTFGFWPALYIVKVLQQNCFSVFFVSQYVHTHCMSRLQCVCPMRPSLPHDYLNFKLFSFLRSFQMIPQQNKFIIGIATVDRFHENVSVSFIYLQLVIRKHWQRFCCISVYKPKNRRIY